MKEKLKDIYFSIIVPVYNVEEYLKRCIESLIEQTYKNIEIILVDDGSTDNCSAMCDSLAKKDKRIKAFHKNNGGLSDARNFGLRKAKGEYILFVDSDDYIELNAVNVQRKCHLKHISLFSENVTFLR
jgi:glycosyltransferase involved in cell wall biosynthesis